MNITDKENKQWEIEGLDWIFEEQILLSIDEVAHLVKMRVDDAFQEEDAAVRNADWSIVLKAFHSRIYVGTYRDWEKLSSFLDRWGGYTSTNLQRAVIEGNGKERIFSLAALGLLEPSDEVTALIAPFLESKNDREQWAGTIALGRHKYEPAFPLLQHLLLENFFADQNAFHSKAEQQEYIQGFGHNYGIGRLEEDNYVPPDGLESHPF